jgi:hypothetical protein
LDTVKVDYLDGLHAEQEDWLFRGIADIVHIDDGDRHAADDILAMQHGLRELTNALIQAHPPVSDKLPPR